MAYSLKKRRHIEAFANQNGYELHRVGKGYWSLDPVDASSYDLTDERSFPVIMGRLDEILAWMARQADNTETKAKA